MAGDEVPKDWSDRKAQVRKTRKLVVVHSLCNPVFILKFNVSTRPESTCLLLHFCVLSLYCIQLVYDGRAFRYRCSS